MFDSFTEWCNRNVQSWCFFLVYSYHTQFDSKCYCMQFNLHNFHFYLFFLVFFCDNSYCNVSIKTKEKIDGKFICDQMKTNKSKEKKKETRIKTSLFDYVKFYGIRGYLNMCIIKYKCCFISISRNILLVWVMRSN